MIRYCSNPRCISRDFKGVIGVYDKHCVYCGAIQTKNQWKYLVIGLCIVVGIVSLIIATQTNRVSSALRLNDKSTEVKTSVVIPPTLASSATQTQVIPTATITPNYGVGSTQISPVDRMKMVYVPAGKFTMGSEDSDAYDDEKPEHIIYADSFWIDEHEITISMYKLCVSSSVCTEPTKKSSWSRENYYNHESYQDFPIINIDWSQAKTYCEWAGRSLPTEAQWEKAARGSDSRKFPWGNLFTNGNLANFADSHTAFVYSDNSINDGYYDTSRVGNYPNGISPYGVLDMAGNVWEWTADWYDEKYYANTPENNPLGPESGNCKVIKGGSWFQEKRHIRTSNRWCASPNSVSEGFQIGFRCVVSKP